MEGVEGRIKSGGLGERAREREMDRREEAHEASGSRRIKGQAAAST